MSIYELAAVLVCGLATLVLTSAQDANEAAVVQGNNAFANKWLQIQIKNSDNNNILLSPYSAEGVLSMLLIGAGGTTLSALAQGLGLPEDKDVVAKGFQSLIEGLQQAGNGNITLSTANRIYTDTSFVIKDYFKSTLEQYFYSDILTIDFAGNPDQSRISINEWVEEQTRDRIQDLLPDGSVTSGTRTVLVNAIYFKGNWTQQFDEENTESQEFHTTCEKSVQVDLMNQQGDFSYGDFEDYEVVQLNYQGDELHMLIILPKDCNTTDQIFNNLEALNISEIQENINLRKVDVTIPKFKIEQTIEMNQDLKELGMGIIFTSDANFSNISDEGIEVSVVIQKTFIEVSEEGTEAAAATAGAGIRATAVGGPEPEIIHFRADHPFLFALVCGTSNAVLFLGAFQGN